MRALVACAAACCALVAACAAPPAPVSAVAPPGERAGCIDVDISGCMLSLAGSMMFDPNIVARELELRRELDVNGKPARRSIAVAASFPGRVETIDIVLRLAPEVTDDRVVKVAVALPYDPVDFHTVREYDQEPLYDLVSTLLGRRCPMPDKLRFYRFFENEVKPRMVSEVRVERPNLFSHTIVRDHADRVPYCGIKLSFLRITEWDGELMSKSMPSLHRHAAIALE